MRVPNVTFTRVLSDRCYGNLQATVHVVLDEGDDPAEALARAKHEAEMAVRLPFREQQGPELRDEDAGEGEEELDDEDPGEGDEEVDDEDPGE